ncbi:MAG: hypothetical protein KJ571_06435 [Bacteroidetes bacterium]|nr:hypothetical protein [Bacteroidota bacterium]
MIKTILTLLVLSFIFCSINTAQIVDTSSVDVRAMLDKQISEIRAKQQENEAAAIPAEVINNAEIIKAGNSNIDKNILEFLQKDFAAKLFVLVELVMLLGLIYLWAAKVKRNKKRKMEMLKSNIKKLREEQIGSIEENNLSTLRGKLRYYNIKTDDNGKDITFRARKNSIGKGEIHLAAKIQLLAGEYK